jgi:hypothetical protein
VVLQVYQQVFMELEHALVDMMGYMGVGHSSGQPSIGPSLEMIIGQVI